VPLLHHFRRDAAASCASRKPSKCADTASGHQSVWRGVSVLSRASGAPPPPFAPGRCCVMRIEARSHHYRRNHVHVLVVLFFLRSVPVLRLLVLRSTRRRGRGDTPVPTTAAAASPPIVSRGRRGGVPPWRPSAPPFHQTPRSWRLRRSRLRTPPRFWQPMTTSMIPTPMRLTPWLVRRIVRYAPVPTAAAAASPPIVSSVRRDGLPRCD